MMMIGMRRLALRRVVDRRQWSSSAGAIPGYAQHYSSRSREESEEQSEVVGRLPGRSSDAGISADRPIYQGHFRVAEGLYGAKWDLRMHSRMLSTTTKVLNEPSRTAAVQVEEEEVEERPKKDPSPEDCDQAFEGLTKAKAQHAAAPPKKPEKAGIAKRAMSLILGIGPALRMIASMSRADWAVKMRQWKKATWDTIQHFWVGTKLLSMEVRISARLLLKLARGKPLSRRERQQLTRTAADLFRLVPMAVFVIVPFMEFLLPVFLKVFPNMLPSTFKDKMKEQEELKKRLNARMQYAKFLQDTVQEMAKELKTKSQNQDLQRTAEDLAEFLQKVRTGGKVNNEDIIAFAKLFNDELTLDNISRSRLVSMCKYMGIQPYGTDAFLRYSLRQKLARIKADDRMIQSEGVDSLSEAELRAACRDRGILEVASVDQLKQQLSDWLDLSLNHSLPSSLLILSRAFVSGRKLRLEEAVQATLLSLPDEVVESVGVTVLPSEDALEERKRKLEYLQSQDEFIKEENEDEQEEQERLRKEEAAAQIDKALSEMNVSTAKEALELAKEKTKDKQDQLCKLSSALAVLASASSVSRERGEFLRLVNNEIGFYNSMLKKDDGTTVEEARKAYEAARTEEKDDDDVASGSKISKALSSQIDSMLQKLEKEIDEVDAKIGDEWRLLDRDSDGKVTPEEVAAAAAFLKDTLGNDPVQELVRRLVKDKDGKILVEDIVKLGTAADSDSVFDDAASGKQA